MAMVIDLSALSSAQLLECYVQLRQVDDEMQVLPTADHSHLPTYISLTIDNLNKKVPLGEPSEREAEAVLVYCDGQQDHEDVAQVMTRRGSFISSRDALIAILDSVFIDGRTTSRNAHFSLLPLLKKMALRKTHVDELRTLLTNETDSSIRTIAEEMLLEPTCLMTLLAVLFAEINASALFAELDRGWHELDAVDVQLEMPISSGEIDAAFDEAVRLLEETAGCRSEDEFVMGEANFRALEEKVMEEMEDMNRRQRQFADNFSKCVDQVHGMIAEAPVVVIDDDGGPANLLPAKLKNRADKLVTKAQSGTAAGGGVGDADVEIVDVHKPNAAPRQPWGPTQPLPPLVLGEQCFARPSSNSRTPFRKAVLKAETNDSYTVLFIDDGTAFVVPKTDVAYRHACQYLLEVGMRVLAYATALNTPNGWYSGTVGAQATHANNHQYLIFFDAQCAQYVSMDNVKLMRVQPIINGRLEGRDGWRLAPTTTRDFLQRYLTRYPDWPLVRVRRRKNAPVERIGVEKDGHYYSAMVLEVDRQMALLRFPTANVNVQGCSNWPCAQHKHVDEWIYRGSTRFRSLNDQLGKSLSGGGQNEAFASAATAAVAADDGARRRIARRPMHRRQFELAGAADRIYANRAGEGDDQDASLFEAPAPRAQTARKSSIRSDSGSHGDVEFLSATAKRASALALQKQNMLRFVTESLPPLDVVRSRRRSHPRCAIGCIADSDDDPYDAKFKGQSPYMVPLLLNWERQVAVWSKSARRRLHKKNVFYIAPCGRRLRNLSEVTQYLKVTHSKLTIDLFTFDSHIRPDVRAEALAKPLLDDYSCGFEDVPIPVVNSVDAEPVERIKIEYEPRRFPAPGVDLRIGAGFCSGCSCTDDCSNEETCECRQLTREMIVRLHPSLRPVNRGYKHRRLDPPSNIFSGIFECNDACGCSKKRCFNRVVQQPLRIPLQLFKTAEKGWGIRSLIDLPAGTFVCIYAGMIMTDLMADNMGREAGDEYFADLDLIESVVGDILLPKCLILSE
uniref:MBD domain-containing protein n=1 Tax=Plectus sambesii TaxID=2011161 RepID=A0A914WQ09_9BILA